MKIALVHEFLNQFGGAERTLLSLSEIYPSAPVYVLLLDKTKLPQKFNDLEIRTSFLQKWPNFLRKRHKLLLPFYPAAIEQFDLSSFDIVISDSNSFAKGILTKPETKHICYCHTPTAYLWHYSEEYVKEQRLSSISNFIVKKILDHLRIWDFQVAQRVDYFIANSRNVQQRIKKYYHRDSEIIYPPVDVAILQQKSQAIKQQLKERNYFLVVSRLSPYKKVDLVIEVFNKLGEKLLIIGTGSELSKLKKMAKPNVKFLGFCSDEELIQYYQNCRALIFPVEEDFGIVPVEAMAFGKPVIAYKKGGVLETQIEEKTAVFFLKQNEESLRQAIAKFIKIENKFDSMEIKKQARKFDKKIFQKKIREFVENVREDK